MKARTRYSFSGDWKENLSGDNERAIDLMRQLDNTSLRATDLGKHSPLGERVNHLMPRDDVRLSDRLHGVYPHRVSFSDLHDLSASALTLLEVNQLTLPKLPFPTTLSKSKLSIPRGVP